LSNIHRESAVKNYNLGTKYGVVDDDNISPSSFDHPICVFNAIDMIQVNGFLNTISIRFDSTKSFSANKPLVCYLVSSTNDLKSFLTVYKCQLQPSSNKSTVIHHYKTAEKKLFVTPGQYIAIAFTDQTGFPSNVPQRNQHSVDLDQIENVCSIAGKRSIQFNVESELGVAISFTIDPSPGKSTHLSSELI
jgi:hypothetical protein